MSQFPSPRLQAVMRQLISERRNPPQVRVAAAGALARMGALDEDAYDLAIRAACQPQPLLEESSPEEETVSAVEVDLLQQLTAVALGYMDRPDSVNAMYLLMQDENPDVQVAAAMGVLRQVPTPAGGPAVAPDQPRGAADQAAPAPGEQPGTAPADEPDPIAPAPMPKLQTSGAKE